MANNFEIIINDDQPVLMADGSKRRFTIDDAIACADKHNCKWICAPHIPDENASFHHWHFGIHTSSDNTYDTIAKWFGLPTNAVQGIKKRFGSTYALYIIHYNQPGKTPVPVDRVRSNFDLDYDKLISNVKTSKRLDEILEGIDRGTIKQYNYHEHISQAEYVKYERYIKRAFDYRTDLLRKVERDMKCIFITGDSGVGKTTYAKQICTDRKFNYYVSSGSNDVLDDYRGEEAIILDDLRPSCMSLSDLLKMLDNNTASSVKSRFRNKVLECKLIVVTSTKDIDTFFSEVFANENETKVQLMRRCELYIQMDRDFLTMNLYNRNTRVYDPVSKLPNPITAKYAVQELSQDQKLQLVADLLGSASDTLDKLKQGALDGSYLDKDDFMPMPSDSSLPFESK